MTSFGKSNRKHLLISIISQFYLTGERFRLSFGSIELSVTAPVPQFSFGVLKVFPFTPHLRHLGSPLATTTLAQISYALVKFHEAHRNSTETTSYCCTNSEPFRAFQRQHVLLDRIVVRVCGIYEPLQSNFCPLKKKS